MKITTFKDSHIHFLLVCSALTIIFCFTSITFSQCDDVGICDETTNYVAQGGAKDMAAEKETKETIIGARKQILARQNEDFNFVTNIFGEKPLKLSEIDLPNLLNRFFRVLFALVGTLLVISIMIEGVKLIYSQLNGNVSKIINHKNKLYNMAIGIIILLLSWVILNTVNPKLLDPELLSSLKKAPIPTSPSTTKS